MRILVNGEGADVRGAQNVAELIDGYRMPPQAVLVEHNGVALHRREWRRAIGLKLFTSLPAVESI